uniref:Vitamin K-dependent protein S n=1 Tax=Pavo cristatus TaxID=9049 RepID=A0A8C9L4M6_PAVCR
LSHQYASEFLARKRRANSFMEESKKGNLERECVEELCNKEEAREIFENNPETVSCLASYRAGVFRVPAVTPDSPADLRACVNEISNQCSPLPCHRDGYKDCIDGQARYTCICKPGWQGEKCEEDINECEDFNGGCSQRCSNLPGSYRCLCEDGYFMHSNKRDCRDINECALHPNICGTAVCKNTLGKYECECAEGYTYNSTSKNCEDIDECAENTCAQLCVNSPGSYSCYCDGKKGFKLSKDMKNCESVPVCIPLNLERNYELLYLAEQFTGIPVLYLKFKLPNVTRFSAEFDFRTYDSEGVILYAESLDNTAWILLALRDGKIEIQFKNEFGTKVTSGGKAINDGLWHIISVEELENSISVKIAKEAVMNINSPGTLFKQSHGFLETKVYIAGLPRKVGDTLIKQVTKKVMLIKIYLLLFVFFLCSHTGKSSMQVGLLVTRQQLQLSVDSRTDQSNSEQLSVLHQAMMTNVVTYLGGLPDVPLGATLVTAFYNGCMEVKVNSRQLDLDEAILKHNSIRSHSCPLIME